MISTIIVKKLLVVFIIFSLSSCKFIANMDFHFGPTEIVVNQQFFSLQWDFPGVDPEIDQLDASSFRIYYREHGTFKWYYLSEIPSSNEGSFFISEEQLDYGVYDFAVSYINKEGMESELHTSLDSSANPISGWYINWYFEE